MLIRRMIAQNTHMRDTDFEELRPYRDHEVQEAIARLVNDKLFDQLMNYLFPDAPVNELRAQFSSIDTIDTFQRRVMHPAARSVIDRSCDDISYSGFEKLAEDKSYLFISNHRDIILDSAILNVLLMEHGRETCEVAIGNNLLLNQWIVDLVKLNKNFTVHRDISPKELYDYSLRLSSYIRYNIQQRNTSVWIAQREGRTKDGDDRTQQGLLKMLGMSGGSDFYENYSRLRLAPMAISYEYDPCDMLKAQELQRKEMGLSVAKRPQDDLQSMVQGMTGIKGRVHLKLGKIVDEKLKDIALIKNKNEQMQVLADLIDERIHRNYHLWPTNLIAYDKLFGMKYKDHYGLQDVEKFESHIAKQMDGFSGDKNHLLKLIYEMYAMPVINKQRVKERDGDPLFS